MCMLRSLIMMVKRKRREGRVWELRENSNCGAIGTACKDAVLGGVEELLSGEFDKAAWSCSGLLLRVLPTG